MSSFAPLNAPALPAATVGGAVPALPPPPQTPSLPGATGYGYDQLATSQAAASAWATNGLPQTAYPSTYYPQPYGPYPYNQYPAPYGPDVFDDLRGISTGIAKGVGVVGQKTGEALPVVGKAIGDSAVVVGRAAADAAPVVGKALGDVAVVTGRTAVEGGKVLVDNAPSIGRGLWNIVRWTGNVVGTLGSWLFHGLGNIFDWMKYKPDAPGGSLTPVYPTYPSEPVVTPPATTYRTYTVKKGDNLWDLAERFLGDGQRWRDIYKANRSQIDDPNLIYPGQKFKIPTR